MPKIAYAMSNRGCWSLLMSIVTILNGLPRLLVRGQMILLTLLLGHTMCVGRSIL